MLLVQVALTLFITRLGVRAQLALVNLEGEKEPHRPKQFDSLELDAFVEAVLQCRNIPAATVSIIKLDDQDKAELSYTRSYGRLDPGCQESNCAKATENTRFCIGSITKAFTAGVLGEILLENKKFKDTLWDTPLKKLLPCDQRDFFEGDSVSDKVTVRDLLAHRMGVAGNNLAWQLGAEVSRSEIWKNVFRMQHDEPNPHLWRSSFIYNNWMYALAGHISELLTNKTWEDLVEKYYFKPLNMKSSTFVQKGPADWSKFAMYGSWDNNKWTSSKQMMDMLKNSDLVSPAGGICTTSVDMLEYMRFVLSNYSGDDSVSRQIISDTLQPSNVVNRPYAVHKPNYPLYANIHSTGFGWFQGVYRDYRTLQHPGGLFGYLSNIFLLEDMKVGVFVSSTNKMFNHYYTDDVSEMIAYHALDLILGETPFVDIDNACSIYPQAFYNINVNVSALDSDSDNSTFVQFECKGLDEEFRSFEGVYQSSLSSNMLVRANTATDALEFTLGTSVKGKLCRTNPSSSDNPLELKMFFEDAFEVYNKPSKHLGLKATVTFLAAKAPGEVASANVTFFDAAKYHWIGPLPTTTSSTEMPTAQPFAGASAKKPRNTSTANGVPSSIVLMLTVAFIPLLKNLLI